MATNNEIIFVSKGKVQKTIADNLTAIRDYLNLNNRNFAKLMDVTEPTISNYCNGVRMQPIDFLINVCKLNELKAKNVTINVLDLISDDFVIEEHKTNVNEPSVFSNSIKDYKYRDLMGSYYCYFYDQSKPFSEQNSISREMRYGLITLTINYNAVLGTEKVKAYGCFYKADEMEEINPLREQIEQSFSDFNNGSIDLGSCNASIKEIYRKTEGFYEGEVQFSDYHSYIEIVSEAYNDRALIILNIPKKKKGNPYLGGLGTVASSTHGQNHLPCVQKIILSKYVLNCSEEEISEHLNMKGENITNVEDTNGIAQLCQKLYSAKEAPMVSFLDENDKKSIIENRMLQLIRGYIERNVCCVRCVTDEDDKKIYRLIKRNSK